MRISDWSSDVCSSDLRGVAVAGVGLGEGGLVEVPDESALRARCRGQRAHGAAFLPLAAASTAVMKISPTRPMTACCPGGMRSEERRGGKGVVRPCRFRWSPYNSKKQ